MSTVTKRRGEGLMKHGYTSALYFSLIVLSPIQADFKTWLNNAIDSVKNVVSYLADDIELEFGWLRAQDSALYKKFKDQSDQLQKKIILSLNNYEKNDKTVELQKAEKTLEQLLQIHDVLLAEAQKKLKPADFERLQKAIEIRQKHLITIFEKLSIRGALEKIWQKYSTSSQKKILNDGNPFAKMLVIVDQSQTLLPQEDEYRKARQEFLKIGYKKYFGLTLDNDDLKTIAFVGTGGGYRALTLTLGYLKELEAQGLLHALSYISTLSGSTWFLGPWMFMGGNIKFMQNYILGLINQGYFNLEAVVRKMDLRRFIDDVIWPKFVFGQPLSSVDLYGGLLAEALLSQRGNMRQKMHLSDQWNTIQDGSYPFPIYTAASMHHIDQEYRYHWYEFTPLEVRNLELNLAIPAFAFDWEFDKGQSSLAAPEQSFGFLMGIFGSAYSVNLKDIVRIMFAEISKEEKQQKSELERIKYRITRAIIEALSETPKVGSVRVAPAQINNPFKGLASGYSPAARQPWLNARDYLTFVDSGIDYNIPVRPLFRPERGVQAIVIGESSGNVEAAADMKKVFADIKRLYNFTYERVDDKSNKTLHFYKDKEHAQAPVIVYVNFLKDENLIKQGEQDRALKKLLEDHELYTFDPLHCVQKDFCNTFNFNYSSKEFLQLAAMAEFNMRANKPAIEAFLRKELFSKDTQKAPSPETSSDAEAPKAASNIQAVHHISSWSQDYPEKIKQKK